MSIYVRSEIKIYCDGGTHHGLEFSTGSNAPMTEARAFARRVGWTVKSDGRVLCPQHAKEARRR